MSPKKILPLLLLSLLSAWSASPSTDSPRGRFVELHSCEVFAGSCVVSSEANAAANYVLRVWQFDRGSLKGVPLSGLTVALLEKGDQNLAVAENRASDAVAYLPTGLSAAQRTALLDWAREKTAATLNDSHVKVVPLQAQLALEKVTFSAGHDIAFSGATPLACDLGGCGQMLWYEPRDAATSFVVDELGQSRVVEPLLSMQWMDHGRQTLFVGRFGDPEVTVPALCGEPAVPRQTASL
jgi:hypothetical protein